MTYDTTIHYKITYLMLDNMAGFGGVFCLDFL